MIHTVYSRGCRSFFVCEVLWDEISRALDSSIWSKLKTEEGGANMIMQKSVEAGLVVTQLFICFKIEDEGFTNMNEDTGIKIRVHNFVGFFRW